MYLQYSDPLFLSPFAKCLEGIVHHQRVHLCCSVLTDLQQGYVHLLSCIESLAVVHSLWLSDRNRMNSGENDDTWCYRTPSFFMTMQGITPLLSRTLCTLAMGDSETCTVLNRYESMRLRSLRQSEKNYCEGSGTTLDYPCYRAVYAEHQQRWPR